MDRMKYSYKNVRIYSYRIHSFSTVYILRFAFWFVSFTTVSRSFLFYLFGLIRISQIVETKTCMRDFAIMSDRESITFDYENFYIGFALRIIAPVRWFADWSSILILRLVEHYSHCEGAFVLFTFAIRNCNKNEIYIMYIKWPIWYGGFNFKKKRNKLLFNWTIFIGLWSRYVEINWRMWCWLNDLCGSAGIRTITILIKSLKTFSIQFNSNVLDFCF